MSKRGVRRMPGAPCLDFETWETTNRNRPRIHQAIYVPSNPGVLKKYEGVQLHA
jgi:hypothetical protein